jgi:UDP-glucose 4-epimerase
MRRILVTGAASWIGGRLVQRLETRPETEVIAVDELKPRLEFGSAFHESTIDTLEFARFFLEVEPHAVIHLQTIDRAAQLGRARARARVVIGAQALFGALERCHTVEHVVVKSDAAFYGAGPRHPSILDETSPTRRATSEYTNSIREMESVITQVDEDLPRLPFTVLRFAPILGTSVGNPISRFLRLPVVPTMLGSDPRLQLVSEEDALQALEHALDQPTEGTFNVAADGQMYLSRILRLGRRVQQPLPPAQFRSALKALRRTGLYMPPYLQDLLRWGGVMSTDAMRAELGFRPSLTCRQAVLTAYGRAAPRESRKRAV